MMGVDSRLGRETAIPEDTQAKHRKQENLNSFLEDVFLLNMPQNLT